MSVLTAYYEAFDAADHATMDALLHDAFEFNPSCRWRDLLEG